MLHARHDFLADITALFEVYRAKLVIVGLMGKQLAGTDFEAVGKALTVAGVAIFIRIN
jgi:hypothetical protein